eukprot:scaffold24_cov341-Pavlova_lutheri.AAC.82
MCCLGNGLQTPGQTATSSSEISRVESDKTLEAPSRTIAPEDAVVSFVGNVSSLTPLKRIHLPLENAGDVSQTNLASHVFFLFAIPHAYLVRANHPKCHTRSLDSPLLPSLSSCHVHRVFSRVNLFAVFCGINLGKAIQGSSSAHVFRTSVYPAGSGGIWLEPPILAASMARRTAWRGARCERHVEVSVKRCVFSCFDTTADGIHLPPCTSSRSETSRRVGVATWTSSPRASRFLVSFRFERES